MTTTTLTESLLTLILTHPGIRAAFPRLAYLWNQAKSVKPCHCRNTSQASLAANVLLQAKIYVLALPPDQKTKLKKLLNVDTVVAYTVVNGKIHKDEF